MNEMKIHLLNYLKLAKKLEFKLDNLESSSNIHRKSRNWAV